MVKICCLLLFLVGALHADEWPRWRGEAGDGRWNPASLKQGFETAEPERLWLAEIGGGYGGVTVSQGKVYLLDRQEKPESIERILCYAADSGRLAWSQEWPADYGRMDYDNGPRSSVNLVEGRAYVLGATGIALCLNAASGEVLWKVDTVKEHAAAVPTWGFAASPVVDGKQVLLHVGSQPSGSILSLDSQTGKILWRGGPDPTGYCTPEIITHEGVRQLIAWGPENIQSLAPDSGATLWTYPYKITYGVSIAQPLYQDGILLVSGYWHGTKALKLGPKPELLWENEKEMCGLMSAPLFKDGLVYLLDKNKGLQCFELATGKIRWSDRNTLTPKDRNPQMSLVWMKEREGLAALLNASGELVYVRLKPDEFEELGRHQIIGKTWAHPAFVGNRVYARSDTQLAAWRLWPD